MEDKAIEIVVTCPICGAKSAHSNTSECVKVLKREITSWKTKYAKSEEKYNKTKSKYDALVRDTEKLQKVRETLKDLAYQMAELTEADEVFRTEEYDRW